ncbi:MAG TPA: hypothetical protein P5295_15865 [Spirochaetota bacterium]|nr:hypothetical protein [Spirochaetota bacterium]
MQQTIDKYQQLYMEALMEDSAVPRISTIKPIFENLTEDEFIEIVKKMVDNNDHDLFQQFLYYLLLFRDMKHLQTYINSDKCGIEIIEKLMFFSYGYCTLYNYSTERILDELLYFISNERLLDLVLNSKFVSRDKLLLFFILSKFETPQLNIYFSRIRDVGGFIEYFLQLPEELLRSIISRSYRLFQYIMLMMADEGMTNVKSKDFFMKYKSDIEQFSILSDVIRKYKSKIDVEKEKGVPFSRRDMGRISFLVNKITEQSDPLKAFEYFANENVFIDQEEKEIVRGIISSPVLKNSFRYYDRMFTIE